MLEINSYHPRDESEESIACRQQSVKARDPPRFETQGRHHQKSKTGVPLAPQIGLMPSKFF